jgi:hypothetical protein
MKQLLTLGLIWIGFSSFAAPDTNGSAPILPALKKHFTEAKEMQWVGGDDVVKIEFSFNNQYVTGFYDAEGNLLGLAKNIISTQLPLLLEKNLREGFTAYWISGVLEYSTDGSTTYYAMVENANQKVVLQSSGNSWNILKKIDK